MSLRRQRPPLHFITVIFSLIYLPSALVFNVTNLDSVHQRNMTNVSDFESQLFFGNNSNSTDVSFPDGFTNTLNDAGEPIKENHSIIEVLRNSDKFVTQRNKYKLDNNLEKASGPVAIIASTISPTLVSESNSETTESANEKNRTNQIVSVLKEHDFRVQNRTNTVSKTYRGEMTTFNSRNETKNKTIVLPSASNEDIRLNKETKPRDASINQKNETWRLPMPSSEMTTALNNDQSSENLTIPGRTNTTESVVSDKNQKSISISTYFERTITPIQQINNIFTNEITTPVQSFHVLNPHKYKHHHFLHKTMHHLSLVPIEDGPFGSLIWKDKKYLISVMIPIIIGILGAACIIGMTYTARYCQKFDVKLPEVRTPVNQQIPQNNDQIVLLSDSSEEL